MPLAYDLDYAALDGVRFNQSLMGEAADGARTAKPMPKRSSYGYIFDWDDYYAPRALYRFMKEGVYARVLINPKTIKTAGGERRFREGAIFVPISGQTTDPEKIFSIAQIAAKSDEVDIFGINSGNAKAGNGDLGSRGSVRSLKKPEVLLLFDDGIERYDAGQLWHLLDRKMRLPVVLRDKSTLGSVQLSDYTHIILPGGRGVKLNEADTKRIAGWVKSGGTLIATKQASIWAQEAFLADDVHEADEDAPSKTGDKDADSDDASVDRINYADKNIHNAEHYLGGAIFGADLDPSHPIGFGHRDRDISVMRAHEKTLKTPKDPSASVAIYKPEPLLSGYSSDKRLSEIANTPMVTANRSGRGTYILFADDPAFRATFPGGDRLFMNAIFFSSVIDRAVFDASHMH